MKLEEITQPYDLLTDRIIISRDIPYITDANVPHKLDCEISVGVTSKTSAPEEQTAIKKILSLDNSIDITYQFNIKVVIPEQENRIQLYSASCEIIQILTYEQAYYRELAKSTEMLRNYIRGAGIRTAWTRWRAQIDSFLAAAHLPVPDLGSTPPVADAEQIA